MYLIFIFLSLIKPSPTIVYGLNLTVLLIYMYYYILIQDGLERVTTGVPIPIVL